MNPIYAALAVGAGAVLGALLRWWAGLWLNPLWQGFPLGTLLVNLAGGLVAGGAFAYLQREPNDLMRLLLVTGGLGALTTFSTFSVEVVAMLQHGRFLLAFGTAELHLIGSLALPLLDMRMAGGWFPPTT